MKTFDVTDVEEAAAESEQDRIDHRKLMANVSWLLKHEDSMRVPIAVRRLVDLEVEPIIVAKTLAIGDRGGGMFYLLATRGTTIAVAEQERICVDWLGIAIREIEPDLGATLMVAGVVWLATQCGLDRAMLANLVRNASVREKLPYPQRHGFGVVDMVDLFGVGDRGSVVTAIELAQLPTFAPLSHSRFEVPE